MKKKVIGCCIFFICVSFIFAEGTENKKKFIKGNLSEKTAIVKQAPVNEVVELATDAIDFAINNKEILGDDKELAVLAVVGITMLPQSYFESIDDVKKAEQAKTSKDAKVHVDNAEAKLQKLKETLENVTEKMGDKEIEAKFYQYNQ